MISKFSRWLLNTLILSTILLVTFSIQSSPSCEGIVNFCSNCPSKKPFNRTRGQVIRKCDLNYTDKKIIDKCQSYKDDEFVKDNSSFTPITSTKKNITYWNVHCGRCNFEKELNEFESWRPWLFCDLRIPKPSDNSSAVLPKFVNSISNPEILDGLRADEERQKVIYVINNSTYFCNNIFRDLPEHLNKHVKDCDGNEELDDHYSPQVDIINKDITSHFHPGNNTRFCSASTVSEMESFCDYRDEHGDTCSVNLFLNRTNDNNSICNPDGFIWLKLSNGDDKGTWNQCSNRSSKQDTIYVCGPAEASVYKKIKQMIFKIMDYVSTFLLFLFLMMSSNKQNLRSLPKRIFYSYSWSLWALYLCEFILIHIESCVIKYYVFYYIWQSHSFWILITAFDLWRIVNDSMKLKRISVENQQKRFLIYSVVGWILPVILLAALFPTLEDVQKSWSCPSIAGFENELICFSRCQLNKYANYFGWITISIFLVIAPCLLVLTFVYVCLSWRSRARSNVNKTYTVTLVKVAVMMGLHWMLLVYLSLINSSEKFNVVYEFISSFHGSFIFLAFGLEKSTLNTFKESMLKNRTNEQTQCTSFTQISQDVKSSNEARKSSSDGIETE